MKGVIVIPAPKPIMVKDLHTMQTRAFKSQTEADKYYNKKSGYFKDIKTKLGGKNRHYEIIEVV